MGRAITDYQGNVIGTLNLPEGTPEEVWLAKLNEYRQPPEDQEAKRRLMTIVQGKQFAVELMQKFKDRNLQNNMTLIQGLWLHQRIKNWTVSLPPEMGGFTFTVDIMNMADSGDIESAYISFLYGELDEMTEPYHCVDQDMIDWVTGEMSSYLGFSLA